MAPRSPFRAAQPADPVIRLRLRSIHQIFNSMDPSPFIERDLDDDADAFIIDWAHDAPARAPLALEISVTEPGGDGEVAGAVHRHFRRRSDTVTRRLRHLMHTGRISTVIGLSFLAGGIVLGDAIAGWMGETHSAEIFREGLHLLGWVSTWKPVEIFLYGWWPLVGERKLYDRLSVMPVTVRTIAA